ncbi:hypothetical protein [Streptomyces roseoverticillatus]|uniref:Uncharacterized protein n=1 Tax=Streptomyces roseoverticillatus TaxID=66429 RepID=A0ABV3ILY0_9ACTN
MPRPCRPSPQQSPPRGLRALHDVRSVGRGRDGTYSVVVPRLSEDGAERAPAGIIAAGGQGGAAPGAGARPRSLS